jgi:hypothetical protein
MRARSHVQLLALRRSTDEMQWFYASLSVTVSTIPQMIITFFFFSRGVSAGALYSRPNKWRRALTVPDSSALKNALNSVEEP